MKLQMNLRKARVAGLLGMVVSLTGCQYMQTTDPYTGEQEINKTTKGAAIGAATGAAIGLITGDDSAERKKRALILAGVGGPTAPPGALPQSLSVRQKARG